MNRYTCFIILLICIAATVHADGGQLHCGERGPVDPYAARISLQGPPGKVGPPGPQAVVDYSIVTRTIDAKVNEALTELRSEILSVKTGLQKVQHRQRLCDVRFNGICFFTVIHDMWDMNFTEAEAICIREDARVADIYSKTHHEMLLEHVRSKPLGYHTWIWTGLRANPATTELFLRNGDEAPFVDWRSGFPESTPSHKNVLLSIYIEPNESIDGMLNNLPAFNVRGVICQFD